MTPLYHSCNSSVIIFHNPTHYSHSWWTPLYNFYSSYVNFTHHWHHCTILATVMPLFSPIPHIIDIHLWRHCTICTILMILYSRLTPVCHSYNSSFMIFSNRKHYWHSPFKPLYHLYNDNVNFTRDWPHCTIRAMVMSLFLQYIALLTFSINTICTIVILILLVIHAIVPFVQ